jgi:hypothetical protein
LCVTKAATRTAALLTSEKESMEKWGNCYTYTLMFFFLQRHGSIPPRSPFGSSFLVNGVLFLLFGLLILAEPDLIAYIIATLLIFTGASMMITWWRLRR